MSKTVSVGFHKKITGEAGTIGQGLSDRAKNFMRARDNQSVKDAVDANNLPGTLQFDEYEEDDESGEGSAEEADEEDQEGEEGDEEEERVTDECVDPGDEDGVDGLDTAVEADMEDNDDEKSTLEAATQSSKKTSAAVAPAGA